MKLAVGEDGQVERAPCELLRDCEGGRAIDADRGPTEGVLEEQADDMVEIRACGCWRIRRKPERPSP